MYICSIAAFQILTCTSLLNSSVHSKFQCALILCIVFFSIRNLIIEMSLNQMSLKLWSISQIVEHKLQ